MSDAPVAPVIPQAADAAAAPLPEALADERLLRFLSKAREAERKVAKPGRKAQEFWYRGQSDQIWNLLPGLFRTGTAQRQEKHAYQEWVRRADLIEKPEEMEWNHLFNMQHYGVPTRLLDWTESFAVAVGFSLVFSNYGEKSIPRIFILDPLSLR